MMKHSPTPWRVGQDGESIVDKNGAVVCDCNPDVLGKKAPATKRPGNMQLIVDAVNRAASPEPLPTQEDDIDNDGPRCPICRLTACMCPLLPD